MMHTVRHTALLMLIASCISGCASPPQPTPIAPTPTLHSTSSESSSKRTTPTQPRTRGVEDSDIVVCAEYTIKDPSQELDPLVLESKTKTKVKSVATDNLDCPGGIRYLKDGTRVNIRVRECALRNPRVDGTIRLHCAPPYRPQS